MYGILNDDVALRSWKGLPCATLHRGYSEPVRQKQVVFDRLLLADGKTEMPEDDMQKRLISKGFLSPCKKGEKQLADWQKLIVYPNEYMSETKICITGRCNYNCLHCFNAVDNAPLQTELTLEQIITILDEAKAAGILTVDLTGGEPMLHPAFEQIVDAVYERGMRIRELITNGAFLTGPILQKIKKCNPDIQLRISFDGLESHDWMRGVKGAQEQTLKALRLCRENEIRTLVHINMNRRTLPSIPKTLEFLDELGVEDCKIMRTFESPRAKLKCADELLPVGEYFDEALKIAEEYVRKPHRMELTIWKFIILHPSEKKYYLSLGSRYMKYDPATPVCKVMRQEFPIDSEGNVFPCLQVSGTFQQRGINFGNVFRDGIRKLLEEGPYLEKSHLTGQDRIDACEKCRNCRHVSYCNGGCPALTILNPDTDNSLLGYNMLNCIFFEGEYDLKAKEIMKNYVEIKAGDTIPECS